MELREVDINEIKPYENNPRNNDNAVNAVMESIKQCGYFIPSEGICRCQRCNETRCSVLYLVRRCKGMIFQRGLQEK